MKNKIPFITSEYLFRWMSTQKRLTGTQKQLMSTRKGLPGTQERSDLSISMDEYLDGGIGRMGESWGRGDRS
jgi:hypothetical protein